MGVCVTAASPFLGFNTSLNCSTGKAGALGPGSWWTLPPALTAPSPAAFFQGYPLSLSASSRKANLIVPYPETDNWYLSLQLMCPESPE